MRRLLFILTLILSFSAHADQRDFTALNAGSKFGLWRTAYTAEFLDYIVTPANTPGTGGVENSDPGAILDDGKNGPAIYSLTLTFAPENYDRILKGYFQITGKSGNNLIAKYEGDETGNFNDRPSNIENGTLFKISCRVIQAMPDNFKDPKPGGWSKQCSVDDFKFLIEIHGGASYF